VACLKCGKETEENQVFCECCREVMRRYPVEPNTVVIIPKRPNLPEERKLPRKKRQEDREKLLRSAIRWLTVTTGVLTIVICILCGALWTVMSDRSEEDNIGRNYTYIEPTAKTDPTTNPTEN